MEMVGANMNYSGANGYRYGYNGHEHDDEWKSNGNSYDYGARIYDPRLARFLSIDPLVRQHAWQSPYAYAANSPILLIDIEGEGEGNINDKPPTGVAKIIVVSDIYVNGKVLKEGEKVTDYQGVTYTAGKVETAGDAPFSGRVYQASQILNFQTNKDKNGNENISLKNGEVVDAVTTPGVRPPNQGSPHEFFSEDNGSKIDFSNKSVDNRLKSFDAQIQRELDPNENVVTKIEVSFDLVGARTAKNGALINRQESRITKNLKKQYGDSVQISFKTNQNSGADGLNFDITYTGTDQTKEEMKNANGKK